MFGLSKKNFILDPKIYEIPFYILIEYLSYRDLIRLSKVDPFLKGEIYHKTKTFTYAIHDRKYADIFLDTFKNVRLELNYENDNKWYEGNELAGFRKISSLRIVENVRDVKFTSMPYDLKIEADSENIGGFIKTKIPTLRSLVIKHNHYLGDRHFDDLLNLENLDLRICAVCTRVKPELKTLVSDQGLMRLVNLRSLTVACPNVTDNCFSKLTYLTKLDVRGNNNISDRSIERLTDLVNLSLMYVPNVTDHGISVLTNLQRLKIVSSPNISNDGIRHLSNIKCLSLQNTENISWGLEYLINLEKFSVDDNSSMFKYLSPVYFNKLTDLTLAYCANIDDSVLIELTNLGSLSIDKNVVLTDDSISRLTNLKKLKLEYVGKITGNVFKNLGALEDLYYKTAGRLYEKDMLHLTNLRSLTLTCQEYILEKGGSLKSLSGLTYLNMSCGKKYYAGAYEIFPDLIRYKTPNYPTDVKTKIPSKLIVIVIIIVASIYLAAFL
ncbi:MAG: hypothetical protein Hyperionvirus5_117 [Hyperionvirus sp.]|uniref:Leucine-rich repeat protein n=1 Tax=Hyperionvirus sp. TaxID=2487770 RepID=A0A3G5AAQ7_9VIRU|nr:MAG: hypothetical protein Hyperionvirus5_117 [Hyperionvirus sp.]